MTVSIFPKLIESRKYGPSNDYWYQPFSMPTNAGVPVTERDALKYLTVFACVSLISGDVGRLPLNLYRRRKDVGKDLVTDHKAYDLLHNAPNEEMGSFNWREAAQGHLLLWGNHYSYIERDKMGKVAALWPIPDPGGVQVRRKNDRIIYEYEVDSKKVTRRRDEIFHIPGYGYNGLVGMSMISVAKEAIGVGLAAETFGASYFSKGTNPSGILSLPEEAVLGEGEAGYLKKLKADYSGLGKSHSVMVLTHGETYKPLTVPLDDAQFLQTRDHQKIEICGMYHVPPHKIAIHGQNSNYNNLEQENASYVDSCLMHWLVRWESAINLQLLTEKERRSGLFFEFLVAGLLRGDSQARAEFYNKIFQVGGISPNEIRSKENMNPDPSPAADQKYVMLNMIPLDKAGEEMTLPGDAEPEKEPEIEEKQAILAFFSEDRAKKVAEKRSIQARDRIAKRYRPLILDAAQAIVNRETKAIKKRLSGRQSRTESDAVADFLNDFYNKFPEYINRKMGPVLRSYLQAVVDESISEIGGDDAKFDKEVNAYVQRYAERHASSSLGQMIALLEGDVADLDARADEWMEKRPEKIASDEAVRASSAAFSWVVFGAGMSLVWRIRGAKTCVFCQELNGKRIASGQSFVSAGDEIKPGGEDGPMKFYGMKLHPPLHQKCTCYVSAG